jgi:hypothetical protein
MRVHEPNYTRPVPPLIHGWFCAQDENPEDASGIASSDTPKGVNFK